MYFFFYHSFFSWPSILLQNTYICFILHMYFTISFIAPALYNMRTFQVAILISLILFHYPVRIHSR